MRNSSDASFFRGTITTAVRTARCRGKNARRQHGSPFVVLRFPLLRYASALSLKKSYRVSVDSDKDRSSLMRRRRGTLAPSGMKPANLPWCTGTLYASQVAATGTCERRDSSARHNCTCPLERLPYASLFLDAHAPPSHGPAGTRSSHDNQCGRTLHR